jgi:SNF family Na+-dependent transporter
MKDPFDRMEGMMGRALIAYLFFVLVVIAALASAVVWVVEKLSA